MAGSTPDSGEAHDGSAAGERLPRPPSLRDAAIGGVTAEVAAEETKPLPYPALEEGAR